MKNKHFHTILALALTLALASAALASPSPVYADSGGGVGTLTASGNGMASISGNGTVIMSGNGVLWIRDRGGDASILVTGKGVRREFPNGWIRYAGFQGQATVTGSDITVKLSGYGIDLQAVGAGTYILRGHGTYSVEKDGVVIESGAWTRSARPKAFP